MTNQIKSVAGITLQAAPPAIKTIRRVIMKHKVTGFILAFCLAVLSLSYGDTVSAAGGEPITLSVLSSWPKGYPDVEEYIVPWMTRMEKATGGRLKLRWMGGPETVHPFEQLKAVQRGLADILYTHPAYHAELV